MECLCGKSAALVNGVEGELKTTWVQDVSLHNMDYVLKRSRERMAAYCALTGAEYIAGLPRNPDVVGNDVGIYFQDPTSEAEAP